MQGTESEKNLIYDSSKSEHEFFSSKSSEARNDTACESSMHLLDVLLRTVFRRQYESAIAKSTVAWFTFFRIII